mmetsp:Transcript_33805/g.95676  ORF Transcript_33805/g.95676 Transcript_33805/m.95676 type:complete len:139 (-) Transcript_33805:244-660(-)
MSHPFPVPAAGTTQAGAGADVESRYASAYEDQLNPFSQFQAMQKDSQRRKMGVPERTVYMVGSLVFGNKYARLFVFFYTIVLHLMIFMTMFRMSHVTHHTHVRSEALCSKEIFLNSMKTAAAAAASNSSSSVPPLELP